ncbi:hypothetical protein SR870_12385 [Rhodopseudomonas palustris]|uniref:hypothetical protein n=1 Tax=Rhodopseudomonas palustris TaxID=1076 RepID=UPI002ACE94FA|nr:hypothetical protein [Rhodopseudomonas palustris]WQG97519.1 hypothetical protein SR870_12385 [Rhodopseudomonas palustris]
MFDGVSHSRLDGSRLLLSGDHARWKNLELDGAIQYLRGTSNDLVVRTTTEFDNVWQAGGERISAELYVRHTNYIERPTLRPVSLTEKSATRFGISAEITFAGQHVYGFEGERFLGRAQSAFLYVVSAERTRAAVEFHGGDEARGGSPFLNISIQLSYDVFQSTFKPLWLGAQRAAIDVTVGVCGFRQTGSSLDQDDTGDFVMASGAWSAELKSLSLAISSPPS